MMSDDLPKELSRFQARSRIPICFDSTDLSKNSWFTSSHLLATNDNDSGTRSTCYFENHDEIRSVNKDDPIIGPNVAFSGRHDRIKDISERNIVDVNRTSVYYPVYKSITQISTANLFLMHSKSGQLLADSNSNGQSNQTSDKVIDSPERNYLPGLNSVIILNKRNVNQEINKLENIVFKRNIDTQMNKKQLVETNENQNIIKAVTQNYEDGVLKKPQKNFKNTSLTKTDANKSPVSEKENNENGSNQQCINKILTESDKKNNLREEPQEVLKTKTNQTMCKNKDKQSKCVGTTTAEKVKFFDELGEKTSCALVKLRKDGGNDKETWSAVKGVQSEGATSEGAIGSSALGVSVSATAAVDCCCRCEKIDAGKRAAATFCFHRTDMPRVPSKDLPYASSGSMERRRPPFLRPSTARSRAEKESPHRPASRMENVRGRAEGAGFGSSSGDEGPGSSDALLRQNQELRRRLEDEASNYKRRLDTYRQAQQHQAALVSRLQAKVLQYKQRCSELENQMVETLPAVSEPSGPSRPSSLALGAPAAPGSALDQAQQHLREMREERIHNLDTALRHLDEEKRKCENLMQLNKTLREQLEESHQTNEALTSDLQKLTNDWEQLREEMIVKEDEWKDEEQAFNDYYTTEHNRLLGLWRDVVSVKRLFNDVQTSTERDLNKLRSELVNTGREMSTACNTVAANVFMQTTSPGDKTQYQWEAEMNEYRAQIQALHSQHETSQNEIRQRDERIQQLLREVHNLEERCSEAEHCVSQVERLQDEIDLLHGALRDIAHAVLQDAEGRETDPQHMHLTPQTPVPQRSPKRAARTPTSPAFAESTISAVRAALHKYQLHIHELQVKLQSNKEQLLLVRKQCENADENGVTLESRIGELTAQLDSCRAQCSKVTQERDSLRKTLDGVRAEKAALERNRADINSMIEALNSDYEKLQKSNGKLQKLLESLEDEKIYLQNENDRLHKEGEIREMALRSEEDRCSRFREELLTVRDELEKLYLTRDMLEQQKLEADTLISHLEKNKGDVELELEHMVLERSDLQDALAKAENKGSSSEDEKKRLQEEIKKLENDKVTLQSQCTDQQSDLGSLRKELLQAEQTRLDLESDKVTLNERIKFLEIEKEKLEMELSQVSRERSDLSNQLSVLGRKKEALNEELMRTRQRLEQANEMNSRINRNLEDLVKENEEKQCLLENNDKEYQRLQEQLASVRSEKEALEGVLFDTQTNLEATDIKRLQLEKDQQDLLIKQESLKEQINRLTRDLEMSEKRSRDIKNSLTQQAGNQEAEFQQMIANLKRQSDENIKKLSEEKEHIRMSLEKKLQQSIQQLGGEKDDEIQRLQERIEALQQHIENICQQHEEVLLRAENDKQQALLIAHHDQQALQERLEGVRRELEAEREALERLRRDAAVRAEQDRATTNQLREELTRIKGKLEENRIRMEEERMRLEVKIEDTRKERDQAQRDAEELKVQVHLTEDRADNINNQLQDTLRKLQDAEHNTENLRKELTDVKRQLTDSNFEKEKYHTSNKEFREHIKRIESDKRETSRNLEEAFQKIASLEDTRSQLEAEKARLQTELRESDRDRMQTEQRLRESQDELKSAGSNTAQLQAEERELQARLASESEERERAQQELHQLKKQMTELDNNLETTRQELGRLRQRSAEREERGHGREQELLARLEDARCREKRLEDQKHNLEVCLADATQQIQELKARLGGAEGRLRALDAQLTQSEAAKRDTEQRLSSVGSTLRRIAGIQLDGTVTMPYRLLSPSRRWSPAREPSDGRGDTLIDVDPEVVRKGVRNLMQQVAQIERERDDFKTQAFNFKKQLSEAHETQNKGEGKLNSVLQNLRAIQDEKNALEAKLGQKQATLQAQNEALKQKTEESQQLRDKVTSMELQLHSGNEEKGQYESKLEKMRNNLARVESEKRSLQEELSRSEGRASKLELQRVSLEGDLQRLQMMLHEKDAHIQKIQEKCEVQGRNVASLEERCASLKSTIDQLNLALEHASTGESELRSEIQSLQKSLLDTSTSSQSSTEKLKQMQKSLMNSENERKVLAERLNSTQQSLVETRRLKEQLQDMVQQLRQDLASCDVQKSGLESQLRLAMHWPPDSPSTTTTLQAGRDEEMSRQLLVMQRERSELKSKVDLLNDKIRQLETEKRNLERAVSKSARSKSYERPEKSIYGDIESVTSIDTHLEQENKELRMKLRRAEAQLAEKEAEIIRLRSQRPYEYKIDRSEIERLRAAQLQAERLLEAREQSHRQQVLRLENQVQTLRDQLNQEVKRRQLYVLRSSRAGREMQHLRQALGDSLRTVSQDPSLDALLLEHETRKLDNTLTNTASLPPALALPSTSSYDTRSRATTPQPK